MAPFLWPEQPDFTTNAERVVWQALRDQLDDGDALLHGLRLSDEQHVDVEIDLVVLMPHNGLVVIEVKGGLVSYADGEWTSRGADGSHRITPTDQALKELYALRTYLTEHQQWSRGWLRAAWMVAFPHTPVAADMSPAAPKRLVIGQGDLSTAGAQVRAVARGVEPAGEPCKPHWVQSALDLLLGRGKPARDFIAEAAERKSHVDRLTADQYRVLDQLALNSRIEVQGGAGSGKTWLAFEQARRWAAAGKRVAMLTYGHGLATYLRERTAALPPAQRPVFVGTFHQLGFTWGVRAPANADSTWWEADAPLLIAQVAQTKDRGELFDALVIDEAQDFADSWWNALMAMLADKDNAQIAIFHDDHQRVFIRGGQPTGNFTHVRLGENLRNTRQIASAFSALVPDQPKTLGGLGQAVRYVECAPQDVLEVATDEAVGLLEQGWEPLQVALLTTCHRHPVQVEQQQDGQDAYWSNFWTGQDMFYGTVMGFKGLERPAVVLAIDGFHDGISPDEVLYCGMSRARDLLIVVCPPEVIGRLRGR